MRCRKGVTLIELLLVVIILGILAYVALPRITTSTATAKINACATNIDVVNTQVEMWYLDKGTWPADFAAVTADANYFPDSAPACPSSGTYSLNSNYRCECDATGH